ncbi:proteoglycan 4 [Biomphalaria glabrata]|nr:proteoglycan 4 [Biomphalaria glabrata]
MSCTFTSQAPNIIPNNTKVPCPVHSHHKPQTSYRTIRKFHVLYIHITSPKHHTEQYKSSMSCTFTSQAPNIIPNNTKVPCPVHSPTSQAPNILPNNTKVLLLPLRDNFLETEMPNLSSSYKTTPLALFVTSPLAYSSVEIASGTMEQLSEHIVYNATQMTPRPTILILDHAQYMNFIPDTISSKHTHTHAKNGIKKKQRTNEIASTKFRSTVPKSAVNKT